MQISTLPRSLRDDVGCKWVCLKVITPSVYAVNFPFLRAFFGPRCFTDTHTHKRPDSWFCLAVVDVAHEFALKVNRRLMNLVAGCLFWALCWLTSLVGSRGGRPCVMHASIVTHSHFFWINSAIHPPWKYFNIILNVANAVANLFFISRKGRARRKTDHTFASPAAFSLCFYFFIYSNALSLYYCTIKIPCIHTLYFCANLYSKSFLIVRFCLFAPRY